MGVAANRGRGLEIFSQKFCITRAANYRLTRNYRILPLQENMVGIATLLFFVSNDRTHSPNSLQMRMKALALDRCHKPLELDWNGPKTLY